MANKVTAAQIAALKELFAMLGKNAMDKITTEEMGKIMRAFGQNPTEAELRDIFIQITTDANGTIDSSQCLSFLARKLFFKDSVEEILNAFRFVDKEGKGYLSAADLRQVTASVGVTLSDDKLRELMRYADRNGDGKIEYEALVTTLLKKSASWK